MLNRHKDELSLEWDKRWEHLQLGKKRSLFFCSPPSIPPCLLFWASLYICCKTSSLSANETNYRVLLSTVLEVMQFARDAHMAEGWMIAQEPYLKNENLGVSAYSSSFLRQYPRNNRKLSGYFRLNLMFKSSYDTYPDV